MPVRTTVCVACPALLSEAFRADELIESAAEPVGEKSLIDRSVQSESVHEKRNGNDESEIITTVKRASLSSLIITLNISTTRRSGAKRLRVKVMRCGSSRRRLKFAHILILLYLTACVSVFLLPSLLDCF